MRGDDVYQDLKLRLDARDALVKERTQLINRILADLAVLVPGYEKKLPQPTARTDIPAARRLVRGNKSVRAELVRDRLADLDRIHVRVKRTSQRLCLKVKESKTSLTSLRGVGIVNAARILGELGDRPRLRSTDAFAVPERYRTAARIIGQHATPPAQPRREPPVQLCAALDGSHLRALRAQGEGVRRVQEVGRKVVEGGHSLPQAPPRQGHRAQRRRLTA